MKQVPGGKKCPPYKQYEYARMSKSYDNPFGKNHSATWETEHSVTLDLRRMRSLLDGLSEEAKEVVIKNLRIAYPYLNIDVLPNGLLRMEAL